MTVTASSSAATGTLHPHRHRHRLGHPHRQLHPHRDRHRQLHRRAGRRQRRLRVRRHAVDGVLRGDHQRPAKPARTGSYKAWLNGNGSTRTDTLSQSVTVPAGCASYTLSSGCTSTPPRPTTLHGVRQADRADGHDHAGDVLEPQRGHRLHAAHASTSAAYAGQTVTLKFTGTEDSSLQTSFVDRRRDVAGELTAYPSDGPPPVFPAAARRRHGSGELRVERGDAAGQPGLHLAAEVVGEDLVRVGLDAVHADAGDRRRVGLRAR